jgi:hypothetical protein
MKLDGSLGSAIPNTQKLIRSIQCHRGLDDQRSFRYVAFYTLQQHHAIYYHPYRYFGLITR